MNPSNKEAGRGRGPFIEWLVRVNSEVASWAASMSWWRLILLILIVLVAASIISDQLHLRHDRVKVVQPGVKDDVEVSLGKDGLVIKRNGKIIKRLSDPEIKREEGRATAPTPATSATSAAPATPATPAPTPATPTPGPSDDDDDDASPAHKKTVTQKIFTFRGLIGDLGSALLVLVFAYLAASKIIVRKVAQADEKVRSAVDAAEHEAMERQLVQARLQVLQAQVEPHFLFNTLAAIDYLIETDPPRASQMQKALINYLRGALPQMRQVSSTLGRELRLIRSFLDLIKMRMEDRLDIEFAVPEGTESAEFPPMILQSLVENAIKHGIEPKPEGGKVTVAASIQNGQLRVEVRDTGVGMIDSVDRLDGPTSGTGIGLQNIRERLAMLYPGKGRLTLVSSDDGSGTVVRIAIPYQVGSESAAMPGTARPQGGVA